MISDETSWKIVIVTRIINAEALKQSVKIQATTSTTTITTTTITTTITTTTITTTTTSALILINTYLMMFQFFLSYILYMNLTS